MPRDTSCASGVVGSWRRTSLNKSFQQGAASLNLEFQTSLPKGRDYLIHKESTSIDYCVGPTTAPVRHA
ncbi:hypothetical protein DPMN_019119 [Dreissena polymorpha]|uniref:Uncharacterized protein n=1 Tax=Dreissena polymorpha TaxID=45954 RepID=A0A9D4S704_DREPO|nr:hypothetical protein DPMN_019119 [Dreissena polymorpha]